MHYDCVWSQQSPFPVKWDLPVRAVFRIYVPIAEIMVLSHLFIMYPAVPQSGLFSLDARDLSVYGAAGPTCFQELVVSWMFKYRNSVAERFASTLLAPRALLGIWIIGWQRVGRKCACENFRLRERW